MLENSMITLSKSDIFVLSPTVSPVYIQVKTLIHIVAVP